MPSAKPIHPKKTRPRRRPLAPIAVAAGFPSPGEDYAESPLSLDELLVKNEATFYWRVQGDSMTAARISDGDILVIDRSVAPHDGHIVLAVVDGAHTVKRLRRRKGKWELHPESGNDVHRPVPISEGTDVAVWGVVVAFVGGLVPGVLKPRP